VGQFVLLALVVLLPARQDWPVPGAVRWVGLGAEVVGLLIMAVAATSLGRGLTAMPLPNDRAQLRTGGLYRLARHPIYSGLILFAVADAAASGSVLRGGACVLLWALLTVKSSWEERRLADRFPGYPEYASRTPRFLPTPWRRR
jgi:protein-S-isoprenylcysteine O-methyltransferase Ste14